MPGKDWSSPSDTLIRLADLLTEPFTVASLEAFGLDKDFASHALPTLINIMRVRPHDGRLAWTLLDGQDPLTVAERLLRGDAEYRLHEL